MGHFLIGCFLNVKKNEDYIRAATVKMNIFQLNHVYGLNIAAAKEHKPPNHVMYKVCKFCLYAYLCISTSQYHI
jgi:hypothetical protein